jgi:thiosulfate/3-mercaptopyruvate sulfurtransferase
MLTRSSGVLLIALTATAAAAVRPELLVTADWLSSRLSDPSLVILHVSRDRAVYDEGHIPGARFLAFSDFAVTRDGAQNELPPVADLKRVFEQVGVTDGSRVILYGDTSVLPATRAFFTLDYLGHGDRTALLDGGLAKWRAESRPLTKEVPAVKMGRLTPRPRPEIVVGTGAVRDLSWAAANKSAGSAVLLDTRPEAQFKDPGHIPGAVHRYWMDTETAKNDPSLRPEADLRKLYESIGVTPDRTVVTYCGSGVQATQTYFTLRYLGYNDVRMYDGSFSEWTKAQGTEVEK